jgi:hypothetical protein
VGILSVDWEEEEGFEKMCCGGEGEGIDVAAASGRRQRRVESCILIVQEFGMLKELNCTRRKYRK